MYCRTILKWLRRAFLLCVLGCQVHSNKELSPRARALDVFFRYLFQKTTAGYVLYGDRPLFVDTFSAPENTIPGTEAYQEAVIFQQGMQELSRSHLKNDNYIVACNTIVETPLIKELIIINKATFKRNFLQSQSLFELALGVGITAEKLLSQVSSPNGFYTTLHGHPALQGILFGYGQSNAITYERFNDLRQKATQYFSLPMPFLTRSPETTEELKTQLVQYLEQQHVSAVPFLEELEDYSYYRPADSDSIVPKIPFSLHLSSSSNLVMHYQEIEKKLQDLQNHPDFCRLVLHRLSAQLPMMLQEEVMDYPRPLIGVRDVLQQLFAEHLRMIEVWQGFSFSENDKARAEQAFGRGLQGEGDTDLWSSGEIYANYAKMILSQPALEKALTISNELMAKNLCRPNAVISIPNRLGYVTTLPGKGSTFKNCEGCLTVQYVVRGINHEPIAGSYQLFGPSILKTTSVIPGLFLGMIGMQVGEKRTIYIHPELAYGFFSLISQGSPLIIDVELLALEETQSTVPISQIPVDLSTTPPQASFDWPRVVEAYMTFLGRCAGIFYKEEVTLLSLNLPILDFID